MLPYSSITQRAVFVQGRNTPHKGIARNMIVQYLPPPQETAADEPSLYLGITATKKLGNAVIRNRVKRKLREAFRLHCREYALPPGRYIIIGRQSTYVTPFATLQKDLAYCLRKIHKSRPL